jgi:hypothetical protein
VKFLGPTRHLRRIRDVRGESALAPTPDVLRHRTLVAGECLLRTADLAGPPHPKKS